MITKTQLISTLDKLPENMTIDQLVDPLVFIEKVENGLADSASTPSPKISPERQTGRGF